MSIPKELYNFKFEEYKESLHILYLIDDKFKLICDDYCCVKLKKAMFQKKLKHYLKKNLHFESLSNELEDEILIYLIRKS